MEGYKVVFLGSSGVGKTILINRYFNKNYKDEPGTSYSASFQEKKIEYNGKQYLFNIWDTPGSEKYRELVKIFLKDVKIIVLVYDITVKDTFLDLQYWLDFILERAPDAYLILVGNKSDLYINRKIKESDGSKFAKVINAEFSEIGNDYLDEWNQFVDNALLKYIKIEKI